MYKEISTKEALEMIKNGKEGELYFTGPGHNSGYSIFTAHEVTFYIEKPKRYHLKPKSYLFDLVLNQYRADKNIPAGFTIDSAGETDHIKTKFTEDEIRLMPEWCQKLDRIEVE